MKLIHCIHMDPGQRPKYEAALREAGVDAEIVFVPIAGALSSSYAQLAASMRLGGRILPQLWAKHPGRRPLAQYSDRFIVCYSAGYKFVEAVLGSTADRDALAGVVALDSIHAALDGDGTASDRQIAPWVDYAMLARDSRKLLWVGHSDVATDGYASTTKTAAELVRLAGGTGGRFRVRAYDERPSNAPKAEHGAALTEWGPTFVGEAMSTLLGPPTDRAPMPAPEPPWRDWRLSLGERCVLWCEAELAAGVREEPPGSNTSPRIKQYFCGCTRRATGKPIGLDAAEWCAAAQGMAQAECQIGGDDGAHGWRISGLEMEQDAQGAGARTWRAAGSGYVPKRGDVCIMRRVGSDPETASWQRHVVRVVSVDEAAGTWVGLGGNEGHAWKRSTRRLDSPDIVGWIVYP